MWMPVSSVWFFNSALPAKFETSGIVGLLVKSLYEPEKSSVLSAFLLRVFLIPVSS